MIVSDSGLDYEVLGQCQYGVSNERGDVNDCSEPACYRVWWLPDKRGTLLCREHFEMIRSIEEREIED